MTFDCGVSSVMDTGDPVIGIEFSHQTGIPSSGEDGVIMENAYGTLDSNKGIEGPNEDTGVVAQPAASAIEKDVEGLTLHEISAFTISKESRIEETNSTNFPEEGQGRGTAEKPSHPKNLATLAKKNKDGKIGLVTSKQPFALATNRRLSNDSQISESITGVDSGRPVKLASEPGSARHSQESGTSCTSSPAIGTTESECLGEQLKHLKLLKRGPVAKVQENTLSTSLSPTASGTKPQRKGCLPSYDFSFKSDERAQKRKEFNCKLEEKIHVKEAERTTLQAKSKESQKEEIKMFRKSLMFKASPMPSFYHEPAPKVELKKIPPTRAKSPKLGRHKTSPYADPEGNSSNSSQSGRLSLDEKVTRNRVKESSPQHFKKPLRKSLPRLPSEKTTLANATEDATSITQHPEKHKMELEVGLTSELSQSQIDLDVNTLAEEQKQACFEQEPHIVPPASELSTNQH